MKKLFGVFLLLISSAFVMSDEQLPRMKFSKGRSFEQCLSNCRMHHRSNPRWVRGEGKGVCFDVCDKAHPEYWDEQATPVVPTN